VLSIRIVYTFLKKAITQAAMKNQQSAHCAQQVTCNLLLFAVSLLISTRYHRMTRHSMRAHETIPRAYQDNGAGKRQRRAL